MDVALRGLAMSPWMEAVLQGLLQLGRFGVKGQHCTMRGPGGGRFWLWAAGRLVCVFISGNQLSACQTFPLAV